MLIVALGLMAVTFVCLCAVACEAFNMWEEDR